MAAVLLECGAGEGRDQELPKDQPRPRDISAEDAPHVPDAPAQLLSEASVIQGHNVPPAAAQRLELDRQRDLAGLLRLQPGPQLVGRFNARQEGVQAPLNSDLDVGELALDLRSPVRERLPLCHGGGRLLDRALDSALVEGLRDRVEHGLVEALLPDQDTVAADLRTALVVVHAPVEGAPTGALQATGEGD